MHYTMAQRQHKYTLYSKLSYLASMNYGNARDEAQRGRDDASEVIGSEGSYRAVSGYIH